MKINLDIAECGSIYLIGAQNDKKHCPTPGCDGKGNTRKGHSHFSYERLDPRCFMIYAITDSVVHCPAQ